MFFSYATFYGVVFFFFKNYWKGKYWKCRLFSPFSKKEALRKYFKIKFSKRSFRFELTKDIKTFRFVKNGKLIKKYDFLKVKDELTQKNYSKSYFLKNEKEEIYNEYIELLEKRFIKIYYKRSW